MALFTIFLTTLVWAQDTKKDTTEITPAAQQAITRGLDGLAKRQGRNGNMQSSVPVAATSMACLAWMASGSTPDRGKYAENIRKGLQYILKMTSRSGYIAESASMFGGHSGMHGHGFATLFLAEVLGMIDDPDLYRQTRDALKRAVELLERAQNKFGGWNSGPDGNAGDDGSGAVAIMQIAALRAARNAGISVNQGTIDRAKKYLLEMTTSDGWYQYNYNSRGSHRSSGLTGPGMYMLGAMDLYEDQKYDKGIKNLMNSAPFLGKRNANDYGWGSWYYYTLFYASLAIYQFGGEEWKKWWPAMRDDVVKRQRGDAWDDPYGGLYSAFALLSLQLPYRFLPMFQDGGRGREGH